MVDVCKEFAVVVPLSQGKVAMVDLEDYATVCGIKWHAQKAKNNWYARHLEGNKNIYMHRVIAGAVGRQQVDHKNGNGLDNRRENLRIASPGSNSANKRRSARSPRQYKGVRRATNARATTRRPYVAIIGHNWKEIFLGAFATPEEAARAYDSKAREIHGEFACVNFPREGERQA